MQKLSLDALAREQLELATSAGSGRSARTVFGGHERMLRQTVIAMLAGTSMAEHVSPGEATLYVLRGRVRLHACGTSWDGRAGDLLVVPEARHSLDALQDSAVILTVVKPSPPSGNSGG